MHIVSNSAALLVRQFLLRVKEGAESMRHNVIIICTVSTSFDINDEDSP